MFVYKKIAKWKMVYYINFEIQLEFFIYDFSNERRPVVVVDKFMRHLLRKFVTKSHRRNTKLILMKFLKILIEELILFN